MARVRCYDSRMVPTQNQAKKLWEVFSLPEAKRTHCLWVARLAVWFGRNLSRRKGIRVDMKVLEAAALLHDIDKAIPKLPNERHPDTAVRVLRDQGMDEVADVVKTHPLHAILDPAISPKTWEAKILYLSDKMVKHKIIGVDERFALWRSEHLPKRAVTMLDAAYPKVKTLEQELCLLIGMAPTSVGALATREESGTIKKA